jgi:hypothetical protein
MAQGGAAYIPGCGPHRKLSLGAPSSTEIYRSVSTGSRQIPQPEPAPGSPCGEGSDGQYTKRSEASIASYPAQDCVPIQHGHLNI